MKYKNTRTVVTLQDVLTKESTSKFTEPNKCFKFNQIVSMTSGVITGLVLFEFLITHR